jgi:hypothetical protein
MANSTRLRESRFRLFWSLLTWEGELRNRRLQDLLRTTSVQASRLIANFRDEFPQAIENDPIQKRWVAERSARPLVETHIEDYLGTLGSDDVWFHDGRVNFLTPQPAVFVAVRAACVNQAGILVTYASMSEPRGRQRLLYPHTIVRLSQRWHVRAWCAQRQAYRDFTLGRMSDPQSHPQPRPHLPDDVDWNLTVDVRIGAHRDLGVDQEKMIRREYFEGSVARRISVRRALVNYLVNDIRAAIDPKRQRPPEFQLERTNADELKPWLFPAGDAD